MNAKEEMLAIEVCYHRLSDCSRPELDRILAYLKARLYAELAEKEADLVTKLTPEFGRAA